MWDNIRSFLAANEAILWAIFFALLMCIAFFVLAAILNRKVFPALIKRLSAEKHPVASILLNGFQRPLRVYLKLAGICFSLLVLAGWLQHHPLNDRLLAFLRSFSSVMAVALRIATVVFIAWGLVSSSDISGLVLRNARHRLDLKMSKSVSRFISAVFSVVVVAIAAVIILSELNYDINGLIAGLGLGGLTIALAAKDSAANFFGGLVIVMEKPFDIGDWISCAGVEGTVEDINLRSTKVRTAPGALTIVPNSTLSGGAITNWSGGMEKRRADFTLQLVYGTSSKAIQSYCEAAQTLLETDPEVLSDSIIVRFSDISASSLDVRVIYYTAPPAFAQHLRVKERINYALLDAARAQGVEFAYPTQSVYLNRPQDDADAQTGT